MTEPRALASPADALEQHFTRVWRERMQGLPMVNPALQVRALGFRPWQAHWLGALVTPWFMNLVLAPRLAADWPDAPERETRWHQFPAGVFGFIAAQAPGLGRWQACSLFSPMQEFADQATAEATALAALEGLLAPAPQQVDAVSGAGPATAFVGAALAASAAVPVATTVTGSTAATTADAAADAAPPSRRALLFGRHTATGHGR